MRSTKNSATTTPRAALCALVAAACLLFPTMMAQGDADAFWERAARTGAMDQNADFTEWNDDGTPTHWTVNHPDAITREEGGGPDGSDCIVIRPGSHEFVDVLQRYWQPPLLSGDGLLITANVQASQPDAIHFNIRIVMEDDSRQVLRAEHPGDGNWHQLRLYTVIPKGVVVNRVEFGVRSLPATPETSVKVAEIVPSLVASGP